MKEGLVFENGELKFYKDGCPYHAGVIQVDGDIYYISSRGRAVKGEHIVHREMGNGILERGTYTFGEDYKLIPGSYVAPIKKNKSSSPPKKPRSSGRKKKQNTKKQLLYGLTAILALSALLLIGVLMQNIGSIGPLVPETEPRVVLPDFQEEVVLCAPAAKLEYDGELTVAEAAGNDEPYRPFLFQYHFVDASGILLVSEAEDLTGAKEYALPQERQHIAIDNLKTGTTYYYQVTVSDETYSGTFRTAPATRYVTIPGLVNTRDIGGYTTLDGKTVRQGLLIRGPELDGLGMPQFFMEETAVETVQETFGFVYEMDLRSPSIYSGDYVSRLGPQVGHRFYRAPMYGEIFQKNYREALRAIFTDLAEPANYPMYLHCTWGRDRAGTVVFLLQGVLNVPQEEMLREYLRSGYSYENFAPNQNMDVILHHMAAYPGDTVQEQIASFLITEIGITEAQIQSIRDIFLY